MDVIAQYHTAITTMLQKIVDTQREPIRRAARRCADAIVEDRYLYVIGTGGHSYIACEELFWRAGGLVPIYPILDPGFSVSHGAWRSNLIERTPGYVIPVLKYHGLGKGDVLIIVNAYGINSAAIDAATEAKRNSPRGCRWTIRPGIRANRTCTRSPTSFSTRGCRMAMRLWRSQGAPSGWPPAHPSGPHSCSTAWWRRRWKNWWGVGSPRRCG